MKAAVLTLTMALIAAGCGGSGGGDSGKIASNPQAVPAVATPENFDPEVVSSGTSEEATGMQPAESVYTPSPAGVVELLKQGDTLWFAGSSGLVALTPAGAQSLKDEPVSAAIYFADRLWIATEGALSTADGLVSIVPEFATAFTC